jgi:hypothetical protein
MNLNAISSLLNSNASSVVSALQKASATTTKAASSRVGGTSGTTNDNSQLSPFAQLLSTLQQIQQSSPTQYAKVASQISTNLTAAATTAAKAGNAGEAAQLTALAKDFTSASQSGQMPSVQDLASQLGGEGHHQHAHAANTGSSQTLAQIQAAFQSGTTQTSANSPLSIIMNTLSSAGISANNG